MERACTFNLRIYKQIFILPNTSLQASPNSKVILPQWEEISDFCELKSVANVKDLRQVEGQSVLLYILLTVKLTWQPHWEVILFMERWGLERRQKQVV